MEEIANDYENIAIHLLDDSNGNKVKSIEKEKRGEPAAITVEIVRHWLQGKGRRPVTWRTFMECLQESGLSCQADYVEAAFVKYSGSYSPWQQQSQQQSTCSK